MDHHRENIISKRFVTLQVARVPEDTAFRPDQVPHDIAMKLDHPRHDGITLRLYTCKVRDGR